MTEKALIIAEKMSLARLYDSAKKYRGASMPYDYDIMQLQGNVVRLKMPEEYDENWHSWDKIPVLPEKWEYTPIKAEKKDSPNMAKYHNRGYEYFKKIYKMLDTDEYAAIVNGCDPDREGQAIFDKMMTLMPAKARKLPQLRLWQDDQEVTTAIKFMIHPYDNKDSEMIALSKYAQSRGILDLLIVYFSLIIRFNVFNVWHFMTATFGV
jgi:DNA topoisomerase III